MQLDEQPEYKADQSGAMPGVLPRVPLSPTNAHNHRIEPPKKKRSLIAESIALLLRRNEKAIVLLVLGLSILGGIAYVSSVVLRFGHNDITVSYLVAATPVDISPETAILQSELELAASHNQNLLDILTWSLGGVVTIAALLLGFSWFNNVKATEADQKATQERLNAVEVKAERLMSGYVRTLTAGVTQSLTLGNTEQAADLFVSFEERIQAADLPIESHEAIVQLLEDQLEVAEALLVPFTPQTSVRLSMLLDRYAHGSRAERLKARLNELSRRVDRDFDLDFDESADSK